MFCMSTLNAWYVLISVSVMCSSVHAAGVIFLIVVSVMRSTKSLASRAGARRYTCISSLSALIEDAIHHALRGDVFASRPAILAT